MLVSAQITYFVTWPLICLNHIFGHVGWGRPIWSRRCGAPDAAAIASRTSRQGYDSIDICVVLGSRWTDVRGHQRTWKDGQTGHRGLERDDEGQSSKSRSCGVPSLKVVKRRMLMPVYCLILCLHV